MASQSPTSYDRQRETLAAYFDGTARKAWIDLTSQARVSGIRATVRAGREEMRATILSWLPEDLSAASLLDAGCGTGALSMAAAGRGATVTAVDVAGGLVDIGRERSGAEARAGTIRWRTGDMLDPALGNFDHVVAMDSLIHYAPADMIAAVAQLAARTGGSLIFTFAPRTMVLGTMHKLGKMFPAADRSPAIVPVAEGDLRARIARLPEWRVARSARISRGFYKSQAFQLVRR